MQSTTLQSVTSYPPLADATAFGRPSQPLGSLELISRTADTRGTAEMFIARIFEDKYAARRDQIAALLDEAMAHLE